MDSFPAREAAARNYVASRTEAMAAAVAEAGATGAGPTAGVLDGATDHAVHEGAADPDLGTPADLEGLLDGNVVVDPLSDTKVDHEHPSLEGEEPANKRVRAVAEVGAAQPPVFEGGAGAGSSSSQHRAASSPGENPAHTRPKILKLV